MTVQAPHPPSAHPNLDPVRRISSRRNDKRVWLDRALEAKSRGTRVPLTYRIGTVRYPKDRRRWLWKNHKIKTVGKWPVRKKKNPFRRITMSPSCQSANRLLTLLFVDRHSFEVVVLVQQQASLIGSHLSMKCGKRLLLKLLSLWKSSRWCLILGSKRKKEERRSF